MSTATTLKEARAIALGGFDGMHLGHQALFSRLGERGGVVVIDSGHSVLTPDGMRSRHTKYPILYLPLKQIKEYDAREFLALLRAEFLQLEKIVVGYDFRFGKDRKYTAADLKSICTLDVEIVDEVKIDGISVHSRYIKELLQKGEIALANRLLGYSYTVSARVVSGQGIASKHLVPTLNVEVKRFLLPLEGVYAAYVRLDKQQEQHLSVCFIGHRVTTDGAFAVELHVLDRDINSKESVEISFLEYLRPNRRFGSLQELKQQIQKDIQRAKAFHNSLIQKAI